jgi:salicylate 5-hydroxylase small subunit
MDGLMECAIETGPDLRLRVVELYAAYADLLDNGDIAEWPALFTDPCVYQVIPRENYDAGLPLAIVRCESRGMLADRVYAIQQTATFVPRYSRHVIGPPHVLGLDGQVLRVRANYSVFETMADAQTSVLNVGCYHDKILIDPAGGALRFAEKLCVYDSLLVPNSIVYPI